MTTIAYDGRYIAADGQSNCDGVQVNNESNKFRLFKGWTAAFCGDIFVFDLFVAEFEFLKKSSMPDHISVAAIGFHKDHGACSLLTDERGLYVIQKCQPIESNGSGYQFALAAMDHGKNAVEAVRYASTRDTNSGGKIVCFDTVSQKFIKVK